MLISLITNMSEENTKQLLMLMILSIQVDVIVTMIVLMSKKWDNNRDTDITQGLYDEDIKEGLGYLIIDSAQQKYKKGSQFCLFQVGIRRTKDRT